MSCLLQHVDAPRRSRRAAWSSACSRNEPSSSGGMNSLPSPGKASAQSADTDARRPNARHRAETRRRVSKPSQSVGAEHASVRAAATGTATLCARHQRRIAVVERAGKHEQKHQQPADQRRRRRSGSGDRRLGPERQPVPGQNARHRRATMPLAIHGSVPAKRAGRRRRRSHGRARRRERGARQAEPRTSNRRPRCAMPGGDAKAPDPRPARAAFRTGGARAAG